jgi:hypothetical protein
MKDPCQHDNCRRATYLIHKKHRTPQDPFCRPEEPDPLGEDIFDDHVQRLEEEEKERRRKKEEEEKAHRPKKEEEEEKEVKKYLPGEWVPVTATDMMKTLCACGKPEPEPIKIPYPEVCAKVCYDLKAPQPLSTIPNMGAMPRSILKKAPKKFKDCVTFAELQSKASPLK